MSNLSTGKIPMLMSMATPMEMQCGRFWPTLGGTLKKLAILLTFIIDHPWMNGVGPWDSDWFATDEWAHLAQLVEHGSYESGAEGSNPSLSILLSFIIGMKNNLDELLVPLIIHSRNTRSVEIRRDKVSIRGQELSNHVRQWPWDRNGSVLVPSGMGKGVLNCPIVIEYQ